MSRKTFKFSLAGGIYFLPFLAMILFVGLGAFFFSQLSSLSQAEKKVEFLRQSLAKHELKNSANQAVRSQFTHADPLYLQNTLSKLPLLKKEREMFEKFFEKPEFTGHYAAESRYQWLIGPSNALLFAPVQSPTTFNGIQESIEATTHSVEVDTDDLREILSIIEGKHPNQPQLLISDFSLRKKQKELGGEVYELSLKLLKRDFLHG